MNKKRIHKRNSMNKKTNRKLINNKKKKKKTIVRKKVNKKKNKKRTVKKKQRGGFPIIEIFSGIGALAASALAAFGSYNYLNLINEGERIEMLLSNVSNIEYLPKYSIIQSKNKKYIERYLKCISNSELLEIIGNNTELLRTVTIGNLLKNISAIDPSLAKINAILSNEEDKLTVDTILLTKTDDKLLNELKMYLLATSTYNKDPDNEQNLEYNKLAKTDVNWVDIIFNGGSEFDPIYDSEVDKILEERGSLAFVRPSIRMKLKKLKNNNKLVEAINQKMNDCTQKQRSFFDYISNTVSWDKNDKCLICPEEDCLIYIYDYYYGFLNDVDNIPVLTKLYILMLCEARIFILSKCIILEALRQESGDKSYVLDILDKIYERDKEKSYIKSNIPEKFSDFTVLKKPSQEGGEFNDIIDKEENEALEREKIYDKEEKERDREERE